MTSATAGHWETAGRGTHVGLGRQSAGKASRRKCPLNELKVGSLRGSFPSRELSTSRAQRFEKHGLFLAVPLMSTPGRMSSWCRAAGLLGHCECLLFAFLFPVGGSSDLGTPR